VDRRWIENRGQFIASNPNAPKSRVSYTWNALLPHWIEWRSIVEEFLAAVDAMRVEGDIEPMFNCPLDFPRCQRLSFALSAHHQIVEANLRDQPKSGFLEGLGVFSTRFAP
jgi:hypothetical protein